MTSQINFEADVISRIDALNKGLEPYGRVLMPFWMSGQAVANIEDLVKALATLPKDADGQPLLQQIDQFIARESFYPLGRAFLIHRAIELPFLQDFSHYIDQANLHYYRKDYLSAIVLLTPLIEGVLLRQMQAPLEKRISNQMLKDYLKTLKPNPFNNPDYGKDLRLSKRLDLIKELLYQFMDKRFLLSAADAKEKGNFASSMLNRNYITHQLDSEQFNFFHDCQTLFHVIDLLLEMLSCQTGISSSYCFLPELPSMAIRESHYWAAILGSYFGVSDRSHDETLLRSHPKYMPAQDTNWLALYSTEPGNREVVMLYHGLKKAPGYLLSSIYANFPNLEETKRQKLTQALELNAVMEQS